MANVIDKVNILNICETEQLFVIPLEQELYIDINSATEEKTFEFWKPFNVECTTQHCHLHSPDSQNLCNSSYDYSQLLPLKYSFKVHGYHDQLLDSNSNLSRK